jgi:hypothetical protein
MGVWVGVRVNIRVGVSASHLNYNEALLVSTVLNVMPQILA